MAATNSLAWIYLHTYASRFVEWHGILGLLQFFKTVFKTQTLPCGLLLAIGSQICFFTWESCLSFTSTPISKEPRPCSALLFPYQRLKSCIWTSVHLAIFPPLNRLLWCLLESWNIFHTQMFFPSFDTYWDICYMLYPIDAVYIDYHFLL